MSRTDHATAAFAGVCPGDGVREQAPPSRRRDPVRGVLRDPDLDRRLARDGFVVVPLVAPSEARAVADEHRRLRGPTGDGFEIDVDSPDPSYRRATSEVIGRTLGGPVSDLLDDHVPFARAFTCKWPGTGSARSLHRDWMYVDERAGHRSVVVWVALGEVTGDNGPLRLVRGSHLVDASMRGTGLIAPWLAHERTIRDRLETLAVPPGHAVVFDGALVHGSDDNLTPLPRLAAVFGLRPRGVPLSYYRRHDDHAHRYSVDDDFMLATASARLRSGPPPEARAVECVPADQLHLTVSELAEILDEAGARRTDGAHLPG